MDEGNPLADLPNLYLFPHFEHVVFQNLLFKEFNLPQISRHYIRNTRLHSVESLYSLPFTVLWFEHMSDLS